MLSYRYPLADAVVESFQGYICRLLPSAVGYCCSIMQPPDDKIQIIPDSYLLQRRSNRTPSIHPLRNTLPLARPETVEAVTFDEAKAECKCIF